MLLGGWWKLLFVHWSCGRWDPTHQLIEDYSHCGRRGWYMYPFSRSPLPFLSYAHIPCLLCDHCSFFPVIIPASSPVPYYTFLPVPCPFTIPFPLRFPFQFLSCGRHGLCPEPITVSFSLDYGSFTKPVCGSFLWPLGFPCWCPSCSFPVSSFLLKIITVWFFAVGFVNEPANTSSV